MPITVPTRSRLLGFSVLCNFAGAVLSFAYFRAIDPSANSGAPPVRGSELGVFMLVFVLIFGAGRIVSRRWMQPVMGTLGAPPASAAGDVARRRALLMPAFVAATSWLGWVLGGLAWGVLLPLATQGFNAGDALRVGFGITFVGGSFVAVIIFLGAERI